MCRFSAAYELGAVVCHNYRNISVQISSILVGINISLRQHPLELLLPIRSRSIFRISCFFNASGYICRGLI